MINLLLKLFGVVAILFLITLASLEWKDGLSFTGISMLYLLLVVAVAYHLSTQFSVFVAVASFLVLNYFFVQPEFTFQVAHIASWVSLISFMVVSLVITSLVKRLKLESIKSNDAHLRADLLRKLAEKLALAEHSKQVLKESQDWLQSLLGQPVFIIHNQRLVKSDYMLDSEQLNAIAWVQANGKALGPSTENWPNTDDWIAPFNRLSSNDPVVFIPKLDLSVGLDKLESIKLALSQIAATYQHLLHKERVRLAEHQAREESIKSTLLASIAHDMRTPLTSILGAATTLNQSELTIDQSEMRHLTHIICAQTKHLARTTENILSLVRLASVSKESIAMNLLSPEEVVATVVDLYGHSSKTSINVKSLQPDLLIYANHDLLMLAITNLIQNAIHANQENMMQTAPVLIAIDSVFDDVTISVSDDGKGFEAGFNESMIKTFSSQRSKGFGLGLPIVLAVAKLHNASLNFLNKKTQGAEVSLVFKKPKIQLKDG